MAEKEPAFGHRNVLDVATEARANPDVANLHAVEAADMVMEEGLMSFAGAGALTPTGKRLRRISLGERGNHILGLLSPLLLLVFWEIGARVGFIDSRFFSSPSEISVRFWELAKTGEIFTNIGWSLWRIMAGFLAGAIPGLIIGLSMGLFKTVRTMLRPIVSALYPIPKLALMPLIVIIFGYGENQKVITIALGVFFMVLINTMAGVLNLDKIYLDVAKNFGASRRDFYFKVALPGALPLIFTGVELGMGMALLLIVAAEMQGTLVGIGAMIWQAQSIYDVTTMFVAFILIAVLGYVFAEAVVSIQRKVVPWKQQ